MFCNFMSTQFGNCDKLNRSIFIKYIEIFWKHWVVNLYFLSDFIVIRNQFYPLINKLPNNSDDVDLNSRVLDIIKLFVAFEKLLQ